MWELHKWTIEDDRVIFEASSEDVGPLEFFFSKKKVLDEIVEWHINMDEYWDAQKQEHVQKFCKPESWLETAGWQDMEKLFNLLAKK